MSKTIIISVTSDLSTDQRILKVAHSCQQNDYKVIVVGRRLKSSTELQVPFATKRLKLLFNSSFLFYAEFNIRLFFLLLFSKADIFLANDTDTLVANFVASKLRNVPLVFDAHELFPEVPELQNRHSVQKFWTSIEDHIFPQLTHCYTVCDSIAEYYNNKYKVDMQVVRNLPYYRKSTERLLQYADKKIILYQGALNIGRGLEWMIDAMPHIDQAILVIIGDGDIRPELEQRVIDKKLSGKVIFKGRIDGSELYKYTSSAHIGLCLLSNMGLSYYYALPNRVFDFIQAGVPILASNFPEIAKIVATHHTGILIDHYGPTYLASVANDMLTNPIDTNHFAELSSQYCWENEEGILLNILRNALT